MYFLLRPLTCQDTSLFYQDCLLKKVSHKWEIPFFSCPLYSTWIQQLFHAWFSWKRCRVYLEVKKKEMFLMKKGILSIWYRSQEASLTLTHALFFIPCNLQTWRFSFFKDFRGFFSREGCFPRNWKGKQEKYFKNERNLREWVTGSDSCQENMKKTRGICLILQWFLACTHSTLCLQCHLVVTRIWFQPVLQLYLLMITKPTSTV